MKKTIIFIILLFLVSFIVNAQDKGLSNFEEKVTASSLTPPDLDDTNTAIVNFELLDYFTKERIKDIHINIKIENIDTLKKTESLRYVDQKGILTDYFPKARYNITMKADKIDTNGKDFFVSFLLDINSNLNLTVRMLPVGSVRGFVYDASQNALMDAKIKFYCSGQYGELADKVTDSYGAFTSDWLPVGNCRIAAEHGGVIGYSDIDIKQGFTADAKIILHEKLKGRQNIGIYFFVIFLIILIILVVYLILNSNKNLNVKKEEKNILSSRSQDILKTLDHKERQVIECLLGNNNSCSQAKVSWKTGIAKTSLVRVLDKLEQKQIIKIEKLGKFKKIELTGWFLGNG